MPCCEKSGLSFWTTKWNLIHSMFILYEKFSENKPNIIYWNLCIGGEGWGKVITCSWIWTRWKQEKMTFGVIGAWKLCISGNIKKKIFFPHIENRGCYTFYRIHILFVHILPKKWKRRLKSTQHIIHVYHNSRQEAQKKY